MKLRTLVSFRICGWVVELFTSDGEVVDIWKVNPTAYFINYAGSTKDARYGTIGRVV